MNTTRQSGKLFSSRRHLTLGAILLSLVLVFSLGVSVLRSPAAQATPNDGVSSPTLEIVGMSPEILVDEDTLTLRVNLSGLEGESGEGLRLLTLVQADPFYSATELDDFLVRGRSDGWDASEVDLPIETVEAAKKSGGTQVTIPIPMPDLPLWNEEAWGPYGVTLLLLGTEEQNQGGGIPSARTIFLWYPPGSHGTTNVNVTVTGTESTTPTDVNSLRASGVTFALSPAGVRQMLRTPSTGPTEVALLPEGGASLSLLATTRQEDLYALADSSRSHLGLLLSPLQTTDSSAAQSAEENPTDMESLSKKLANAGISLVTDVIIADEGWMGLRTVQYAGAQTVLSPPSGLSRIGGGESTPSSRFLIDTSNGQTITDPSNVAKSNSVLDSWGRGWDALNQDFRDQMHLNDLAGRQRVRALTALATQEDPHDTLNLFVNADLKRLGEDPAGRLAEILQAPWVTPVTLKETLLSQPSHIQRWPLHDFATVETMSVTAQLEPLSAQVERTLAVMSAAVSPEDVSIEKFVSSLQATQANLTEPQRADMVALALRQLEADTEVISIVPSATVNVMGRNVPFPVTVSNSGNVPLRLLIGLEVMDPRLYAGQWANAVVPANGSVTVHVPVEAVGAGQVSVLAVAKTEGDVRLDASEKITVNVRADWEDTGTWVVGGILIAFFALGLVRTVRKGRRNKVVPDQGSGT